jgi:hypothetical protein
MLWEDITREKYLDKEGIKVKNYKDEDKDIHIAKVPGTGKKEATICKFVNGKNTGVFEPVGEELHDEDWYIVEGKTSEE